MVLGIVVVGLGILQPINAFFRPHPPDAGACREAMGPGVGSTEFETSSQVQVDALAMKGPSKI